ncbi:MAG: pyrroline-5-carboxylate reductase [Deltaproteobacteria bacterium]|nr:pyrroline-5-carboxylate reductase [Deltaproteobacteria bacterium]
MARTAKGNPQTMVAVIGAGQIGGAAAQVLHESGRYRVVVADPKLEVLHRLATLGVDGAIDNATAVRQADLVVFAVKPNVAVDTVRRLRRELKGKPVISFAAAITVDALRRVAPEAELVRAMPNVALVVKDSFTGYSIAPGIGDRARALAERVLREFGEIALVDENLLDAVTGLSGSGPAYAAIFIEALAYAGLKVGLPRDVAMRSAARTLEGAAKLVLDANIHPAQVKEMVVTPGGTTIMGIYHIEESGIRSSVMRAVDAATERCTEITASLNRGAASVSK